MVAPGMTGTFEILSIDVAKKRIGVALLPEGSARGGVTADAQPDIAPDEDLSQLDDEKRFREQLELDSMDFLDIVMELRKRHRIQIPEDDYINLASMNSTVTYLEPLMKDIEREKV